MRTSKDATTYFDCAFDILASEGFGGLKLAALCRRLGVTTGAFYHHFPSWGAFSHRFLDHWHEEATTRLATLARSEPDPLDQLERLVSATLTLPHRAEAAIRAWSTVDPMVGRLQEDVDRERRTVAYEAFRALVGDDEDAGRFADLGMYILIGFQQAESIGDPQSLEWAVRMLKHAATERTTQRALPD